MPLEALRRKRAIPCDFQCASQCVPFALAATLCSMLSHNCRHATVQDGSVTNAVLMAAAKLINIIDRIGSNPNLSKVNAADVDNEFGGSFIVLCQKLRSNLTMSPGGSSS